MQDGPEPETGTVGTEIGTAGTVFQKPKLEPSLSVKLY